MVLPRKAGDGTTLVSLSVHHNPRGLVWYSVHLCELQGSFTVTVKHGNGPGTMKVKSCPYKGDNAILAKDAFENAKNRIKKGFMILPKKHWVYSFCERDHQTNGSFSAKVMEGSPPPWP